MKETEVDRYRALLEAKREEILNKARQREDIWIVQSNEQIEMVQLAGEREFAVRALERDRKVLLQIGEALQRIHEAEFGICFDCEEPISPKRLAAVPWAAYCLKCQESHDRREAATAVRPLLAA